MTIVFEKHKSLKTLNTFGFDQQAELFAHVCTEEDIEEAVRYAKNNQLPLFILGGGSNLVIVNDIKGLVIQPTNRSITARKVDSTTTHVTAGAGVDWQALVVNTLAQSLPGLENLSLIPGSVGAAPVQNIGAYGVEVGDRITRVKALHIPSMEWVFLSATDCNFRYRHSLFKDKPDEYIISEVEFMLGSLHAPQTSYGILDQHLLERNLKKPTPVQISESVIAIRKARLPDPDKIGNAGSFFHNPKVHPDQHDQLQARYPDLPSYPQTDGTFKLAAGWLIDNLGFKGYVRGGVGVHHAQALVLVNTGCGSGREAVTLANEIIGAVFDTYGVTLEIEPKVII